MNLLRRYNLIIALSILNNCYAQYQDQRIYGDTLHLAYVVLYEDENQLTSSLRSDIYERNKQISQVIEKESQNTLHIESVPVFIKIDSLGLIKLDYNAYTFFEWMDCLMECESIGKDVDIISFTPIKKMPWASDSHSIGFFYKNRICYTLEWYPYDHRGNIRANALAIHKMLHALGYNHQNINMPALKLLNWDLGFPVNTGLEFTLREKDGYNAFYFNRHVLNVLDPGNNNRQDPCCLDCDGLVSKSDKYRKGLTENAYGPYCYDADHDGIIDDDDYYFLSPPVKGPDTDVDGIPDKLDLVPWNDIRISGNIDAGKIILYGINENSEITFTSELVDIHHIKVIYMKNVPVQHKPDHFLGCFPKNRFSLYEGNKVVLVKDMTKPPIARIEVHYQFNGNNYYRPYCFYFPGTPPGQIINEREWFYFLRFGGDIPEDINFYEVSEYDRNFDGFADNSYFRINDSYDWDTDGFPDLEDNLPTVYGKFNNEFVQGIKDSDNDGLADPGCLDFSPPGPNIPEEFYFGEIHRIIGNNRNYDISPYIHKQSRINLLEEGKQ